MFKLINISSSLSGSFKIFIVALSVLAISTTGCGQKVTQDIPIPGIKDVVMYGQQGNVYLSFYLDNINLNGFEITLPIPKLDGGRISLAQTQPNQAMFQMMVPFKSFANGKFGTWAALPDGRPLPDIYGGALPSEVVNLGIKGLEQVHLYLNEEIFGFFIPFNFIQDIPFQLTFYIRDAKGNIIGTVTAIPSDIDNKNGGLFFKFSLEF